MCVCVLGERVHVTGSAPSGGHDWHEVAIRRHQVQVGGGRKDVRGRPDLPQPRWQRS